ncbi:MAG TPA: RNA-binding cell elongation regulator Jag/EloR [bacterium]|nr:RNA-binding cell elongation regulator Jag/EloR [bacterium]
MKQAEASGRSVEEAIDRAVTELGATPDDVQVEVLDAGTRGMLGIGAREARVRVTLKEGAGAVAHRLAAQLLRAMGFAASVRARESDDEVNLEIKGQDLGALIGRRGSTLESLEVLLGLMVAKESGIRSRVIVDVEGYWERRREWLERLAHQTAERVQRDRRPIMLEPMPARERRIVHTVLADHPAVITHSSGEGVERRITVAPRPPAETGGA